MTVFRKLVRRLAYASEAFAKSLRKLGEPPRKLAPSESDFPAEWYDSVYRG